MKEEFEGVLDAGMQKFGCAVQLVDKAILGLFVDVFPHLDMKALLGVYPGH